MVRKCLWWKTSNMCEISFVPFRVLAAWIAAGITVYLYKSRLVVSLMVCWSIFGRVADRQMLPYPAWLAYRLLHHLLERYNFQDMENCTHILWTVV